MASGRPSFCFGSSNPGPAETVTETETVGGDVRKEQIEFDTTEDSTGRSPNRS